MTSGSDLGDAGLFGRKADEADLPIIAKIHKLAYSRNHFTALLSEEILVRYYRLFLDGGTEIYLAIDGKTNCTSQPLPADLICGFAVYGVGIPQKIAEFKRDCFPAIIATSLRHPVKAAGKFLTAIGARIRAFDNHCPCDFLLLSIAVAKPRRGIGRWLLGAVLKNAADAGYNKVGLYVNVDNIGAINTYFSSRFVLNTIIDRQYYMECQFQS